MGAVKEMWMAENERMCQLYIDGEIGGDELRSFFHRRFYTVSEIDDIIATLNEDRDND